MLYNKLVIIINLNLRLLPRQSPHSTADDNRSIEGQMGPCNDYRLVTS
jgi:hypothetical protein